MASIAQPEKTPWDYTKDFLAGSIVPVAFEIQRLLPDSLLFGTLTMFILTGNTTWGVLLTFLVELVFTHGLLGAVIQAFQGPQKQQGSLACRSGFRHPRFDFTRFFIRDRYPSASVFSISAIASYFVMTINYFSDTLKAMGPDWAARVIVAYIFTGLFIVALIGLRFLYACESGIEMTIAIGAGILAAILFFNLNFSLFGPEGINILGLPLLVDKSRQGSTIYICTKGK